MTEINNHQDVIDSRDVIERVKELEEREANITDEATEGELEELAKLRTLTEEAASSEWEDGVTLINEDYFEDYAREFASDIGAIQDAMNWPCSCINWERAAEELQMDYTEVDFDGVSYLYR